MLVTFAQSLIPFMKGRPLSALITVPYSRTPMMISEHRPLLAMCSLQQVGSGRAGHLQTSGQDVPLRLPALSLDPVLPGKVLCGLYRSLQIIFTSVAYQHRLLAILLLARFVDLFPTLLI